MKKLNVIKQNSIKTIRLILSIGFIFGLLLSVSFNQTKSTAQSFEDVLPSSPEANPGTFSNHLAIFIPDSGNASPYLSIINVNAPGARISKLTVNLRFLNNGRADDLDIYLLAPNGVDTVLMSDAGGTGFNEQTFFTFDQAAATFIGDKGPLPTGTGNTVISRPVNYESLNADIFSSPGPGAGTNLRRIWTFSTVSIQTANGSCSSLTIRPVSAVNLAAVGIW